MAQPRAGRILVVDDEAQILDLVRGYLERDGFAVSTASDGPAALAAVRAEEPDVVVLDVMLPGLDGIEVCRQLRTFSDAYILMLARGSRPMWIDGRRGRPREAVLAAELCPSMRRCASRVRARPQCASTRRDRRSATAGRVTDRP
jgi:CheY-like chemotaxis protein